MSAPRAPTKTRARARGSALVALLALSAAVLASMPVEAQSDARRVARLLSLSSVSLSADHLRAVGFVVSTERWIMTRYDALVAPDLESASRGPGVVVHFASGTQRRARIVATDVDHGIALLEVDGGVPATPLQLGDSDGLAIGQRVHAFGTPLGLEGTLTHGLVTARRQVPLLRGATRELLQIDANIGPGPGGPLVDDAGLVVALSATSEPDGDVHYAVPSSDLRDLIQRVRDARARSPSRAPRHLDSTDLGITLDVVARTPAGVRMRSVRRGSPASRAGLIGLDERFAAMAGAPHGTVLLAIDGQEVRSSRELDAYLSTCTPGQTLRLSVQESDEPGARTVEVPVVLDGP